MVFELDLQLAPDVQPGACHGNADRIDWSLLSDEEICNYGAKTELLLSSIALPTDALLCKDCNCTNDSHKVALNQLYGDVVAAITMASQNSIHTHGVSRGNDFNRPGWKEFASDLYDTRWLPGFARVP